jgi:hypothetical protein
VGKVVQLVQLALETPPADNRAPIQPRKDVPALVSLK